LSKPLRKKITSLRELAQELGVSVSSTSRALRNHPRISVDLRERAKKLAREHGYTPNLTQSRAGSRRWRSETEGGITIGLLVDNADRIGQPLQSQIGKYAASLGYRMEPVILPDFASPREAARRLTYRGIEALLVLAVFDEATIREFPWSDFCAVGLMPGYCRAPVPLVLADIELAMGKALHEAHARGYRRPGLALYREAEVPLDDFEKKMAFEYLLRQPKYAECAQLPIFEGAYPENLPSFNRWLGEQRPDVVIGQNGGFYHHVMECGYRIPKDISFISMMNALPEEATEPCAGLIHDVNLLVQAAIQLLDAKLRHFDHAPLQMAATLRLEMPWHEGSTLPVRKL
jgi:LacI family transcriptional regulator